MEIRDDDSEFCGNNSNDNNMNSNNIGLSYNLMKKLTKLENEDTQVRKVRNFFIFL